jgi:hypothetical protein
MTSSTIFSAIAVCVVKDEPSCKPDHHIYVASKASWYEIQDALPQYAELPT